MISSNERLLNYCPGLSLWTFPLRISAGISTIMILIVVFPSIPRQIPIQHLDLLTSASFQIFSNSFPIAYQTTNDVRRYPESQNKRHTPRLRILLSVVVTLCNITSKYHRGNTRNVDQLNVILLIYPEAQKLKLNVFKSVIGSSVETALSAFFYVLPPVVLTPQLWKMASHDQKAVCVLWYHESKSAVTVHRRFRIEFGRKTPTKVSGCKLLNPAGSNRKRINPGK